MEREILGTIYTGVTDDFQRGLYPIARTIKASQHDLAVVMKEVGGGSNEMEVSKLGNIYGFDGGNYAGNVYDSENIAPTLRSHSGGNTEPVIVDMRGRNPDNPSDRTAGSPTDQRLEPNSQGICGTLTSVQKDNIVLEKTFAIDEQNLCIRKETIGTLTTDGSSPKHNNRIAEFSECSYRIRKLTPLECWRLMDFSDEDFHKAESVNSNSQLYKQAGNSLVRVVMAAIMSQLNIKGVKPWNEMSDEERRKI